MGIEGRNFAAYRRNIRAYLEAFMGEVSSSHYQIWNKSDRCVTVDLFFNKYLHSFVFATKHFNHLLYIHIICHFSERVFVAELPSRNMKLIKQQ